MASKVKLPSAGLVEAVTDKKPLGGVSLLPVQMEVVEFMAWCTRVVLVAGRRSGKTRLSALLLVWSALLRPELREYVTPGELIYNVAVATNRQQARLTLGFARRIVSQSPVLAPLLESATEDALYFRNDSAIVAFPCTSAGRRGWPIAAPALDEFGWFTGVEEGERAAEAVYGAMNPSLAQFGDERRMIICSSPNGENELKKQFDATNRMEAEDEHATVAAFQLSTMEVRPDLPASVFDQERLALGDERFAQEFGAEFLTGVSSLLSDADIRLCVTLGGDLSPQEITGAVVGLDVGYRKDRSAAVVCGFDHKDPNLLRVAAIRFWEPAADLSQGVERHAEMVLSEVAQLARTYGATIYADTYESETTRSRLRAARRERRARRAAPGSSCGCTTSSRRGSVSRRSSCLITRCCSPSCGG